MKNNVSNKTKKLTLAEMKNLVPTTKGKVRPTAKFLRENETIIASSDAGGSTMAVYASGFALYKTENHQYVLRLDCIHSVVYELMEDEETRNTYVPLDELDWDTAVLLDGEQRIEADRIHRLSRTTVSMTGTGVQDDEGEPGDMPKNPIPSTSRMADVVCKIIDLQTELKQDMNKLLDLKKEILSTVKCVLNVEHQTVLEKRYLCYESWEQIAVDLGYSSKHIFKVHNAALDDVELLLQKKCDEAKVDTKIH